MIIHQDWMVKNSQRKYPIDDSATAMSDSGDLLPEDFLLDANIWAPRYVYTASPYRELRYLYISSISVTDTLVSMTLLGSYEPAMPLDGVRPETPEVFVPIGVVTLPRPVVPYKNYPVTPLLDGVMGWVAFGLAANDHRRFNLTFSKPSATTLVPKTVQAYHSFPVWSMGVLNGFSTVDGDVKFIGTDPLEVEVRDITIGTETKRAMVLNLTNDGDVLKGYAGKCGGVPESGTCNKQPILSIAGVTPDCDGNIGIEFRDLDVKWLPDGVCIDSDVAVSDVCSADDGLPNEDGSLKSEVAYERPCDVTIPYTMTPSETVMDESFIPQSGSWYYDDDAGEIVGIPNESGVYIGTCLSSWKSGLVSRKFTANLTVSGTYTEAGIYLMDEGLRKVVVDNDGNLWKWSRSGEKLLAGSGFSLSDITITTNGSGLGVIKTGGTEYVFAADDPYWQPSGTCGIYAVGNISAGASVNIAEFTVTEVTS